MTLRLGSMCTGYGGLDLALAEILNVEHGWVADNDPGAAKILAHHWPDVPNLGDITTVDFDQVQPVDVLAAGFPCQDLSRAGDGAGMRFGNRSGLWFRIAHAINILQPRLVVIENVAELRTKPADGVVEPCPWCLGNPGEQHHLRALGAVLGDLAALGFDAEWTSLRASDVGAPHERERVFVVAWPAAPDPRGAGLEVRRVEHHGPQRPPVERGGRELARAGVGGRWASTLDYWAGIVGRPAPGCVDALGQLSPVFSEWMMGLPEGHVTAVPGLTRVQKFTALGNGVVPRQGAAAVRELLTRAGFFADRAPAEVPA